MNPYREERLFEIVKKLRIAEKEITAHSSITEMDLHIINGMLYYHSSLKKGKNLTLSHLEPIAITKDILIHIKETFLSCCFRNYIAIHTELTHRDITIITDILNWYTKSFFPDTVGVYAYGAFHPTEKKIAAFQYTNLPYSHCPISSLIKLHPYLDIHCKIKPVESLRLTNGHTHPTEYIKASLWAEFFATDLDAESCINHLLQNSNNCISMLSQVATEKLKNGMDPFLILNSAYYKHTEWEQIVLADFEHLSVHFH